ncbi:MAG: hypothetical protein K2H02_03395 [Anaeroplasmataceae bacterium]|nr:hypothetical protein [Anaeroplasmataceae bacterium]
MNFKKSMLLCFTALGIVSLTGCKKNQDGNTYTYHTSVAIEPSNFNPHTWETNSDDLISTYATIGFVEPIYDVVKDDGSYTWSWEMATNIEDYTPKATKEEKEKWGIKENETNRMYQISLNPDAKWSNGNDITADDYIYSMQQLLNPKMHNYRASNYVSGDSSIVGASDYYWQGSTNYVLISQYPNYGVEGKKAYIDVTALMNLGFNLAPDKVKGSGLDNYLLVDSKYLYDLYPELFSGDCRLELTEQNLTNFMNDFEKTAFFKEMEMSWCTPAEAYKIVANPVKTISEENLKTLEDAVYLFSVPYTYAKVDFDSVGLYKVDDYKIMYVLNSSYSEFYFKLSMAGNLWLVYEDLYEAGKKTIGDLVTTNYGTTAETYMSYGPYKLSSYQKGKQIRFDRNEHWYGYEDGKHTNQYQTDAIVMDVVENHETVLMGFNQGKYDDVELTATDMQTYGNSQWLKAVNTTYTWRIIFNTDLNVLKTLEKNDGVNKQVLANTKFRKAFSLAIDRQKFINDAVGAGTQAYYLINSLYMYNVENDPNSVYRKTDAAMQAVVDLYGIPYGENETYKTLEQAYLGITGYDLEEARKLMQEAYLECKENGTYKDGQKIKIDFVVTAKSSISEEARKRCTILNEFLQAAVVGTGFEAGGIELAPKALTDYYDKLLDGSCEMVMGAWGGNIYWPYSTIQCYVNDTQNNTKIHEGACWDPTTTNLTITLDFNVDGKEESETMSYNAWGTAINVGGKYYTASFEVKNKILAELEKNFLEFYYCIPIYCDASIALDSKRLKYITDEYNPLYGFGGLRFLTYTYNDAEWSNYVKSQGGKLNYE